MAQSGYNLLFGLPPNEYMRITNAGNVGMGTTKCLSRLTVKGKASFQATSAVSTSGTTVTGNLFTKDVGVGDRITVSGQTRTVVRIDSDTSLAVDVAFSGTPSGNMMILPAIFRLDDSAATAPANVKMLVNDQGSVVLGAAATKQISGGPELISAQGANQDNVVLWCGLTSDTNARFLFSYRGFIEWGAGGSSDQDIALFRSGGKGIALQNFTSTEPEKAFAVNRASGSGADESPEVFAVDTKNKMVRVAAAKLTVKGASSYNTTGTVDVSVGSNVVTGSVGASFRTEVRIGDRIKIVDTGEIKTVTGITNDTSLTVDSNFGSAADDSTMTVLLTADGTVSVNNGQATVTGSGTSFTKQVGLGDRIKIETTGEIRTITAIASDTSLTVDAVFLSTANNSFMSILPGVFQAEDSAGTAKVFVSDQGNVGIGTTNPAAKVQVVGGDIYISDAGKGIILKSPDGTKCRRISLNDNGTSLDITTLTCP